MCSTELTLGVALHWGHGRCRFGRLWAAVLTWMEAPSKAQGHLQRVCVRPCSSLSAGEHFYPYFADEKAEAEISEVTCLRSHSQ